MSNTRNGCNFINWWQRVLFGSNRNAIAARAMIRHTSIVTFMEVNTMLWRCYLLLMFCYDERFLGDRHPVTLLVGIGCLIGSAFMFARQLRIASWGANIRMGIATVIIFWISVEVFDRIHFFNELWTAPAEQVITLAAFGMLAVYLWYTASKKNKAAGKECRHLMTASTST